MTTMVQETKPALAKGGSDVERTRMETWLRDRVERSQKECLTETVTLTPTLAQILLDVNPDNRRVSEATVSNYVRDMLGGRWALNGASIVVAKDGSLNDGQHRCAAVVNANVCVQVVMVFGVPRVSRFTVDQGRTRTTGDYLGMNGVIDANHTAVVASFIWQWREKGRIGVSHGDRPTKSEVLLVVEGFRDIPESLAVVGMKGVASVGGKSLLAFCHWAIRRKSGYTRATEFITQMVVGNDMSAGDPMLLARNRLTLPNRLKANEKAEIIFRAWNAVQNGEKPVRLVALNGALPKLVR